jgi:hypothetical protein
MHTLFVIYALLFFIDHLEQLGTHQRFSFSYFVSKENDVEFI